MFCIKCGAGNPEGNTFCTHCGAPLSQGAPASPQYGPAPGFTPVPAAAKKTKKGLIIGIIAGIVVLLGAAAALYFLVLAGTPIKGLWYNDENAAILEFKEGGKVTQHSLTGDEDAKYEYNQQKGEGTLSIEGKEISFTADKDTAIFNTEGDNIKFKKADKDFDADKYLLGCVEGFYSNQDHGAVIELKSGKAAVAHNYSGDITGTFDYDFGKGSGTLILDGMISTFSANSSNINIDGYGTYAKEDKSFDAAGFVAKYGNPLIGDWYDKAGTHGQFTFAADGTLTLVSYGQTFTGTYTYDNSSDAGTFTVNGSAADFTLSGDKLTLTIEGADFTKEYAEQESDVFAAIEGTWYDTAGVSGTIVFNSDGTAAYTENGSPQSGTVNYNPFGMTGTITLTGETIDFNLENGNLYVGETVYGRDSVAQNSTSIVNTWYDVAGHMGTLTFLSDGTMVFYYAPSDTSFNGTYTFDSSSGTGSVLIDFDGGNQSYNIALSGITLDFNNGEALFSTNYTVQDK